MKVALIGLLSLSLVSACSGGLLDTETARTEIVVSAAASLTDVFAELEAIFEQANPQWDVILNLAGSSALREQILEGAPVDVYASANRSNMDRVIAAGEASDSRVFARNLLQIAVPAGNPGGIVGLEDLGRDDLAIGLCAEGVPCGEFAIRALAKADVDPAVDTYEPDVRSLLTKIEAGELDAGITYRTDVAAARDRVQGIDIPEEDNVYAEYLIAAISGSPHGQGGSAFVDFVFSDQARTVLGAHGFLEP